MSVETTMGEIKKLNRATVAWSECTS